ncbi:MAG: MFS transporter [Alphaproteobacteria bacterium]|nr:MFS transporter [Alphaproteobacteria bacterium]
MLAGTWLVYFCFGLSNGAMPPLVDAITRDLGLSHTQIGSVLGAWPLVYIAAALPCGALVDRIGLRRGLMAACVIMAISGFLRMMAWDHLSLFIAVAVLGLGGPMISVGAPKLIAQWFAGKERGLAMGIYITGPGLGGIVALWLTNSTLMPLLDSRWTNVVLVYALFVLAAGVVWLVLSAHPASRDAERRQAAGPRPPQFQVFAAIIRLRAVQLVLVMSIGIFFLNHGLNNWLPTLLRYDGFDGATADYWASVPTVVGVIAALIIPRLATPARRFLIFGLLLVSSALATLALQSNEWPILAPGLLLQGIARSSLMTVAILILMETPGVDPRNMGAAGGLFFTAAEIGGVLGPLTIGILLDATRGFSAALFMLTAINIGLLGLMMILRAEAQRAGDGPGGTGAQ